MSLPDDARRCCSRIEMAFSKLALVSFTPFHLAFVTSADEIRLLIDYSACLLIVFLLFSRFFRRHNDATARRGRATSGSLVVAGRGRVLAFRPSQAARPDVPPDRRADADRPPSAPSRCLFRKKAEKKVRTAADGGETRTRSRKRPSRPI